MKTNALPFHLRFIISLGRLDESRGISCIFYGGNQ
jgi:hypothetical protein